ncbi:MAG: hypothetical protein OEL53_15835, partial [Rhodospirillales bacterium]|nr:hypothetical protein [Rhodospirillales bacterium]
ARRGKDFIAPMLFSGTADAGLVNEWTRRMLLKELRPASTLILDERRFATGPHRPAICPYG